MPCPFSPVEQPQHAPLLGLASQRLPLPQRLPQCLPLPLLLRVVSDLLRESTARVERQAGLVRTVLEVEGNRGP